MGNGNAGYENSISISLLMKQADNPDCFSDLAVFRLVQTGFKINSAVLDKNTHVKYSEYPSVFADAG